MFPIFLSKETSRPVLYVYEQHNKVPYDFSYWKEEFKVLNSHLLTCNNNAYIWHYPFFYLSNMSSELTIKIWAKMKFPIPSISISQKYYEQTRDFQKRGNSRSP